MPPKAVFKGQTFAISGKLSQPRKEYEELIEKHGGAVAPTMTSAVTFMISTDEDMKARTVKVATAIGKGTPIVQEGFIGACIAAKKLLDPSFFKLKVAPLAKRKAAAASKDAAPAADAKKRKVVEHGPVATNPDVAVIAKSGLAEKAAVVQEGSGVFNNPPEQCEEHKYRESVAMGKTQLSAKAIADLLVSGEWPGESYDLLRCTCCVELGVEPDDFLKVMHAIHDRWQDGFRTAHDIAQQAPIIAAAFADEIDAKYQISSKTKAKAADILAQARALDDKHKLTEKGQALLDKGAEALKPLVAKADELDKQHKISETAQEVVGALELYGRRTVQSGLELLRAHFEETSHCLCAEAQE